MQIDREALLSCQPEEAAAQLHQAGKTLEGANLRRSSWLLIASALHVQRIAEILLQRLQAATTRQDVLRVLRIARKNVRERKKSSGGVHRKGSQEDPQKIAAETSPMAYQHDDNWIFFEMVMDMEDEGGNFDEWLAQESISAPKRCERLPDILPVSALDETIRRYAWDRWKPPLPAAEQLRARLDDETYEKVLAIASSQPTGLSLSESERKYLSDNRLDQLLQYANNPESYAASDPIRDGVALAGVCILEDHIGIRQHPFSIDWQSIHSWLTERLPHPPQPEIVHAVIASAYAFLRDAPAALIVEFIRSSEGHHKNWARLLGYAAQRAFEILPAQPDVNHPEGFWNNGVPEPSWISGWERGLDAGSGSKLVRHHLQMNFRDLLENPAPLSGHYWNIARQLLVAGGGTLRRMDYPAFTLVCRPTVAMIQVETFQELCLMALKLLNIHRWIVALHKESLTNWIRYVFSQHSPSPLPENIPQEIACILEDHAVAYLMLRERVLRDAYQAAPFRIRRKHIQRFWNETRTALSSPQTNAPSTTPAGLQALAGQFGEEAMKEALAHALYDHIKDDWEVPEEQVAPLKETLISLLRHTAITYHLQFPEMTDPDYVDEEDLVHTQEVVNFLIQQTEHAPMELCQALMIEARQGLPLLAGGGRTAEERDSRMLIKKIAGVAQEKIGGTARTFQCQPLSKPSALDRGNLAGDCSSGSVPLRALSPHHVYYGVFENGEQQRGYMTVYEAWAEVWEKQEHLQPGQRVPVLCLETINVPLRIFNAIQQDLLVIFEAIAWSRGLVGGLVLITEINTWNYQNGAILRQSRRFRQGIPVRLSPADPVSWNVYQKLAPESQHYTAFFEGYEANQHKNDFRLLAPFKPKLDPIEPENLAEAQRIASLPPKRLRLTARDEAGPRGFISEFPEIL